MPTIIGFVDQSQYPKNITFPFGFNAEGELITSTSKGWPNVCQLIILEDQEYCKCPIKGNSTPALLIQHNTNANSWEQQKKALVEWGWLPRRVGSFSHKEGSTFWLDMLALASANNNFDRQPILKYLAARYTNADTIQNLDKASAWLILTTIYAGTEKEDQYSKNLDQIVDQLPSEEKDALKNITVIEDGEEINCKAFFEIANRFALKRY